MVSRQITAALIVAIGLSVAPAARADEQSDLDKGRAAYEAKNYVDANHRFRVMLDPATGSLKDSALVKQARMYWAAVMISLKKVTEANAIFEKLLLEDASFEPDPLSFPSAVIDAFIEIRAKMRDRLSAAAADQAKRDAERKARDEAEKKRQIERVRMLEKMASEETVTHTHSRWVALIPFGGGQFQNGQTALGWAFLSSEAALIAGGLITLPIYYSELSKAFDRYAINDNRGSAQYADRANQVKLANGLFYGAAALVIAAGIVQAQVAYVPEVVEIKRRPLPSASIAPLLVPLTERGIGGVLGVTGQF